LVATNHVTRLTEHICLPVLHDGVGRTDGQLLDSFLQQKDKAALAALVRRHGPMVWGCAAGCSAATMTPRTLFKPPS
jgi:hypothetical protein